MIHVAVCDDEESFVAHLCDLLKQYGAETGTEIKITIYYDGLDLIEKYDPSIDLIFLDIQMRLLDGLHTAKRLRQLDAGVGIIFLTTLTRYGLEGYKYRAEDYIIKPIRYVRLRDEMNRFLEKRKQERKPSIVVVNDSGKYRIFLNELLYIETFNRNLLLHTEKENILCYRTMKEMEQELGGKGFARCHTSYLVHLFFVKGVKKLELTLINGETLPISQPKRKAFMEKLTDYWGALI